MPSPVRPSWNRDTAPRAKPLSLARFWLICMFFLFWTVLIVSRLFWLQVVRHGEFLERAERQQQRTFEVAPRRGVLYDRNLRELAMTVEVDSIFAVPTEIDDKRGTAEALAAIVHNDPEDTQTTAEQTAARRGRAQLCLGRAPRDGADGGPRQGVDRARSGEGHSLSEGV